MYEVLILASPLAYNISDWGESPVELSNNKLLGRPPRDWSYQRQNATPTLRSHLYDREVRNLRRYGFRARTVLFWYLTWM
jgi:hypothetical protein